MELLYALLKLLNEEQKKQLKNVCNSSTKAELRLLSYLINNSNNDVAAIAQKIKLSASTINKSQSLAKTFLISFVKENIQTPFDEVSILQKLSLKGDLNVSVNFYNELERTYESKQLWSLLDALYIEGFRIAQIIDKPGFIEQVAAKRNFNINRLQRYVICYGKIMIEMLAVERFEDRKELSPQYLAKMEAIYKEAKSIGHHVLIHNSLNNLYMMYVRYFNEPDKTFGFIKKINENRERYKAVMNPLTFSVTKITFINFLSIYHGFGDPEDYEKDCEATIDAGGVLARVTFYYALIGYYLSIKELNKVAYYLKLLEKQEDTTKFKQYKSIVLAIDSFIKKDFKAFSNHFKAFYSHPTHTDFPDMECILRIMELIVIRKSGDELLFDARLQTLRVYMQRNLNKKRYKEEHDLVNYLAHPETQKNKQTFKSLKNSAYRNTRLLINLMEENSL